MGEISVGSISNCASAQIELMLMPLACQWKVGACVVVGSIAVNTSRSAKMEEGAAFMKRAVAVRAWL